MSIIDLPHLPLWRLFSLLPSHDLGQLSQVNQKFHSHYLEYCQEQLKTNFGLSFPLSEVHQVLREVSIFERSQKVSASILAKCQLRDNPELIAYYAERLLGKDFGRNRRLHETRLFAGQDDAYERLTLASRLLGIHGDRDLIRHFIRRHCRYEFILPNVIRGAAQKGNRELISELATWSGNPELARLQGIIGAAVGKHWDLLKELISGSLIKVNHDSKSTTNDPMKVIKWLYERGYLGREETSFQEVIKLAREMVPEIEESELAKRTT